MEDLSEEYWEVDDYSQPYESKSKLGLIWRKGLDLGKKMVITGVVVSSAPFVVPPLMALSAIGVAFSVPAGFVFVTYACSEKLMSKLLPMPSPPSFEEDGLLSTYEEEDTFYRDDVGKGYEDEGIDTEEREFQDTRNEVQMRLELVDERNNKSIDYGQMPAYEIVEEEGYVEDAEDEEKPLNISGINEEEMRRETTGLIEEMRDEGKNDQERRDVSAEDKKTKENGVEREIPIKDVTENKGKSNLFVIPEEVKPDEDAKGVTNGPRSDDTSASSSSVGTDAINEKVSETKPMVEKKLVVQVKTAGDRTATDVRLETSSDKKRGTLVISDADAREMADESGLDLFDQVTPSPDQTRYPVNKMSKGIKEIPVEPAPKSEHIETASPQDSTAASGKVKPNEEKIWEQINAMRTIVGYKAAPHSSCAEELKALYIFTGVEHPSSSKDRVDLVDIDEKLHFLMSIIGVK